MNRVGIGLVGCGGRLRRVFRQMREVSDAIEVVALCDPDPNAIEETQRLVGGQAHVYSHVEALVRDPQVSWVFVGSWNAFHAEQVLAALEAGKHVYCEKPLSLDLESCLRIRACLASSGCRLIMGFTLRHSAHYKRIKSLLEEGQLGQVLSLEFNDTLHFKHGALIHASWRRHSHLAGPYVLEKCCHDLDMMQWLLSSRVVRVASFGGTSFFIPAQQKQQGRHGLDAAGQRLYRHPHDPSAPDPFTADKDIVDHQVTILEFANGVRASFHVNCHSTIPERRLYLCGSEGTLRAELLQGTLELERVGFEAERLRWQTSEEGAHAGGDSAFGRALVATVLEQLDSLAGFEQGLSTTLVCLGIEAARQRGQIMDLRPWWRAAGIDWEERA